MSVIVLKVRPSLQAWALVHNERHLATFQTKDDADRAALAIGLRHPGNEVARIESSRSNGEASEIRIF